jgi:hypothetical protein
VPVALVAQGIEQRFPNPSHSFALLSRRIILTCGFSVACAALWIAVCSSCAPLSGDCRAGVGSSPRRWGAVSDKRVWAEYENRLRSTPVETHFYPPGVERVSTPETSQSVRFSSAVTSRSVARSRDLVFERVFPARLALRAIYVGGALVADGDCPVMLLRTSINGP